MQRVGAAQARRAGMTDMAIEEMNFAGSFARRCDLQDRRRAADAFKRHEIPEIKIAQCSARIARAGLGPRTQERLDGRAKIGELKRLFDKLNCVRSVAFGGKFGRSAGGDGENARVRVRLGHPVEEFDRVGVGWIEIDDKKLRVGFRRRRFRFAQRFDHPRAMLRGKFLQGRRDRRSQRVVLFDEKNARRCPGRRFVGCRHGGSD